jgi:hypothetical protein
LPLYRAAQAPKINSRGFAERPTMEKEPDVNAEKQPSGGPDSLDVVKEFFRAAYEATLVMRPPDRCYRHRLVDDLPGLLDRLRTQARHSDGSIQECQTLLITIAATAARNYRLAKVLQGAQ